MDNLLTKVAIKLADFKGLDWNWVSSQQNCLIEARSILALIIEVVEGAGLTDEEIKRIGRIALSYDDERNLAYEIERQYKISKSYDKKGFDWAFTDEDRMAMIFQKDEASEWIRLLAVAKAQLQKVKDALHKESE